MSFTPGHSTALLSMKPLATSLKNTPENAPTKKTCPLSISWVVPTLQALNMPRYLPCLGIWASAVIPTMRTKMNAPSTPSSALRFPHPILWAGGPASEAGRHQSRP